MSESKKRRMRRRRKAVRGIRKTFITIVFAPARIPKIRQDTVEMLMSVCEVAAIVFAAVLVAHIAVPAVIKTGMVVFCGLVFAILCGVIKLSDYQEKIEQYRYYGFRI